MLMPFAIVAK